MKTEKTIIDVQDLAQKYLEDEVLMFEIHLFNVKEEMSDESKTVHDITWYLESLYDDFEIHDYSTIHKDIQKYNSDININHNNAYFKLLEKKFSEARISSLHAMLDLCNGKPFKYKINEHDLDAGINNFKLSDTIQKLVYLSGHAKEKTLKNQEAIYELVKDIKTEFENQDKKLNKKSLTGEVHNRINSVSYKNHEVKDQNLTVENIERKYLKHWREV